MRGAVFALIAVAVLAAGGAAFLASRMMSAPAPSAIAEAGVPSLPAAGIQVLVAATDITPGKAVGPGALRWQPWPEDLVRSEYVAIEPDDPGAEAARQQAARRFEGRLARRHIAAGEPLTDAKVFERESVGFLAGTLNSGMRAMSVPVSAENSAGGFVLPGDRVDVILSHDITKSLPRQMQDFGPDAGVIKHAAETVLKDVRVLATDQTVAKTADGEAIVGKTVTLEVSTQQAQVLALATAMGEISLALHSLDSPPTPETAAPVSDVAISAMLARAVGAAARRLEGDTRTVSATAPVKKKAPTKTVRRTSRPGWAVSIYRGGVGRVQTVRGR